jgi:putative acetyltransferase
MVRLGPVSVLPQNQRQGVGSALLREGLSLLRRADAEGCALAGDPCYYERFGFRNIPDPILESIPPEYFLDLPWGEVQPHGTVVFHETRAAPSSWPRLP